MSTSVRRLGKLSLRLAIYSALLLLGFLNAQVILFDQNPSEASLFGFHLSFTLPQAAAYKQQAPGGAEVPGGGYSPTGTAFSTVQVNWWSCYELGTLVNVNAYVASQAYPCYRKLANACVETQVCIKTGTVQLCSVGVWRWVPPQPCNGAYQSPPALLPC